MLDETFVNLTQEIKNLKQKVLEEVIKDLIERLVINELEHEYRDKIFFIKSFINKKSRLKEVNTWILILDNHLRIEQRTNKICIDSTIELPLNQESLLTYNKSINNEIVRIKKNLILK